VLLASRSLLVKMKRDLENQIRGLLKNIGHFIGRATFNIFAVRAEAPAMLAQGETEAFNRCRTAWAFGRRPEISGSSKATPLRLSARIIDLPRNP
jgi:hypothetical protein